MRRVLLVDLVLTLAACAEPDPLEVEVEILTHDQQPMAVDLLVRGAGDATVDVEHALDPGVRAQTLTHEDDEVHVRVRGLAPATEHELVVSVHADDGRATTPHVFAQTGAALPGFAAGFELAVADPDAVDPVFRMFDLTDQPESQTSGLFVVDPEGTTRWYLGRTLDVEGPSRIWTGAKLLADGTVVFLVDNTFVHVDELGEELARIPGSAMGFAYLHHDVIPLPDGHFVAIGNSFAEIDYAGEGTLLVAGDVLVEFTEAGDVVWTWDTFDHLDPQRRREGFDGGFPILHPETGEPAKDWTHANGVIYREQDDSLLLSLRHQDWLVSIDRASRAVNWRLGDEGDFWLAEGTWFFHQHSPQWQQDGSVLLYDNGVGNPTLPDEDERSRAVRYDLDEAQMEATQVWTDAPNAFAAPVAGDADTTPGGNVLVLDSSLFGDTGTFDDFYSNLREVDADGQTVWSLLTPVGRFAYRALVDTRLVGERLDEL